MCTVGVEIKTGSFLKYCRPCGIGKWLLKVYWFKVCNTIAAVTEWLQERLEKADISLTRRMSQALLAGGVGPDHLTTEEQRVEMKHTGLAVVGQGMRVVGVPVGKE